ncbi:hypothetical protein ACFXA4_05335 [Streptomyces sp. NPDC059442]|uniref:DUF7674 family protein n=1 Tax=Streptomyces sp. NPDC059442 TaxID=3346830 RepID=UPI0036BEEC91
MIADHFLRQLLDRIPETRAGLEEMYENEDADGDGGAPIEALPASDTDLDLYGILLDGLVRPVLQPALAAPERDEDLLRRCFRFVEEVYEVGTEYTRGAVYFQVLESLLDAREYLDHAVPFLRGNLREPVSKMLRNYEVEGYEDGLPSL